MKLKWIAATAALVVLVSMMQAVPPAFVFAQQPAGPPAAPAAPTLPDIEVKVRKVEAVQEQVVEGYKGQIQFVQFLFQLTLALFAGAAGLVSLVLTVQGLFARRDKRRAEDREADQDNREREREARYEDREKQRQARQEHRETERDRADQAGIERVHKIMEVVEHTLKRRDAADEAGVEQISKIMGVVHQTLEQRLLAEQEARKQAEKAGQELDNVLRQVGGLQKFYEQFQGAIRKEREALEETASRWAATVPRHEFRRMTRDLNAFAGRLDKFRGEFGPIEAEPQPFSPRVPYIRGIAAHYANEPETAKRHLTEVVGYHQAEQGESAIAHSRRLANAYYYLGLTESNFGNYAEAIACFAKANDLDPQGRDALTRIVTAEACLMANDYSKAEEFVSEVEQGLEAIKGTAAWQGIHRRLLSRALLIRANMAIRREGSGALAQVRELLERVHRADAAYYYATATLAQVTECSGDPAGAKALFLEAYESIQRSEDLRVVTETRSRILLLMFAGMCCLHGVAVDDANKRVDAVEHLDHAASLRASLPRIDSQVCTVFSALSKQNESSETIAQHIEVIRKGDVLLLPPQER